MSIELADQGPESAPLVKDFHQILLWPLQLMPVNNDLQIQHHWENLDYEGSPWKELDDEFPEDPTKLQERHYREFVSFLPHVQRFLYGERATRAGRSGYGESPIRVFRRMDARAVRLRFPGEAEPLTLDIVHTDLYFYYDVDVVLLALEVHGSDLPLWRVQDIMHRFGRAYPGGWTEMGDGANCLDSAEWLDGAGHVLAKSDYQNRDKFLTAVCKNQTPAIAAHWEYILSPLVPNHSEAKSNLRYRLIEHYRMPIMAYLSTENPAEVTRADYVRLAFAGAPGEDLPLASGYLSDFESKYCYDRFFQPSRPEWTNTRILCCGHTFVAVGDANRTLFTDSERGFLAQFRHQLFFLGMIAHFHRAAMLMMSDRLVTTMSRLDITRPDTVRKFRRDIRLTHEVFLRFTHRYFFSEVSDQVMARDLFRMWSGHLGTQKLYEELREEIHDMSHYLETDMLRRQAMTLLQLTVVTVLSLIGTITTGFLGMNIFSHGELPWPDRILIFFAAFGGITLLTFYTLAKSQRLAMFLDGVANEKVPFLSKMKLLLNVWGKSKY